MDFQQKPNLGIQHLHFDSDATIGLEDSTPDFPEILGALSRNPDVCESEPSKVNESLLLSPKVSIRKPMTSSLGGQRMFTPTFCQPELAETKQSFSSPRSSRSSADEIVQGQFMPILGLSADPPETKKSMTSSTHSSRTESTKNSDSMLSNMLLRHKERTQGSPVLQKRVMQQLPPKEAAKALADFLHPSGNHVDSNSSSSSIG